MSTSSKYSITYKSRQLVKSNIRLPGTPLGVCAINRICPCLGFIYNSLRHEESTYTVCISYYQATSPNTSLALHNVTPVDSQLLMCRFECLGCIAHVLEHLSVGAGILQSFSLELNGGQGPIYLCQLLLQPLLSLQCHYSSCKKYLYVTLQNHNIIQVSSS